MKTIDDNKTPVRNIEVSADRQWVQLEDGHVVSWKIYQKILKHSIKQVTKHVVYKIEGTTYFVMRGSKPE